jgi:hypothetical protein
MRYDGCTTQKFNVDLARDVEGREHSCVVDLSLLPWTVRRRVGKALAGWRRCKINKYTGENGNKM